MIALMDINGQYRELKTEIDAAVARVLEHGQFVLGREVSAFEDEFAAYSHSPHAIGVNSGTSALHLALLAAGIGPGDEVITTPFTFFAPVATIGYVGATAVFVDIDPRTFNMDVSQIESRITERTRAILPVHLYGQPADMDPILEIARKHRLVVIEDAAQAHGAEYRGRRVGSIGDIGCFSFYPTKNLGAAGEGGMVTTGNAEYAQRIRLLRDWAQESKYHPTARGYNYRLEAMQAAILRVKLQRLEHWNEARRAHAVLYDRLLEDAGVDRPLVSPGVRHVYHLYVIRSNERDQLRDSLDAAGIQTAIHYPAPIHLLPGYADARYHLGDLPVSEACAKSVLCLPMHPYLEPAQVKQVASVLCGAIARV
jgi:dTDP-4-amino-4,6-dideoxygalactose transaminase